MLGHDTENPQKSVRAARMPDNWSNDYGPEVRIYVRLSMHAHVRAYMYTSASASLYLYIRMANGHKHPDIGLIKQ